LPSMATSCPELACRTAAIQLAKHCRTARGQVGQMPARIPYASECRCEPPAMPSASSPPHRSTEQRATATMSSWCARRADPAIHESAQELPLETRG
jgi:hypothetical protein